MESQAIIIYQGYYGNGYDGNGYDYGHYGIGEDFPMPEAE